MTFFLRVYGLPVPQGRPRATVFAGRARVYERREDKDWKAVVKAQVIAEVMKDPRHVPWHGAVALDLVFYLPRPATLPKKITHHTRRPDADNLGKAIKDCLKGLVYKDDAQVVDFSVRKRYDPTPGVEIIAELWAP